MKTIVTRNREEKEKYKLPNRVQDAIPIRTIWPDGVFLVGKDRYSKTFQFQDINYAVASLEDKKAMFLDYSAGRGHQGGQQAHPQHGIQHQRLAAAGRNLCR